MENNLPQKKTDGWVIMVTQDKKPIATTKIMIEVKEGDGIIIRENKVIISGWARRE